MGAASSTYRSYFDPETEIRIIMVGNNNAGKTTIMYQLKVGLFVNTIPTTGFKVETIHYKNFALSIWEIGIRNNTAFLWRQYAEQAVGVIFVVDSYDVDRIGEANGDLRRTLNELDELGLPKLPLLVYANKQESRAAMSVADVRDQLGLKSVQDREWHIQGSSATMNDGLWEGLDWLLAQVKEDMKKNAGR
jgi:small GTP-binding protein